jgi:hypothetical protein
MTYHVSHIHRAHLDHHPRIQSWDTSSYECRGSVDLDSTIKTACAQPRVLASNSGESAKRLWALAQVKPGETTSYSSEHISHIENLMGTHSQKLTS